MVEYASPYTPTGRGRTSRSIFGWLASLVLWGIVGIILIAIFSWLFVVWFYGIIIGVVLWLGVARSVRQVRRRRAEAVLGYVEQAVRLNLPLPAMLRAAAHGESRPVARQLAHLSELLQQGTQVADALAEAVPHLPRPAVDRIGVSEAIGRLGPGLRRAVEEQRRRPAEDVANATFSRIYPIILLLGTMGMVSLMMIFVMPKYEMIFSDFSIELPAITVLVIRLSEGFSEPEAAGPLLLLPVVALLLMIAMATMELFAPRRWRLEIAPGLVDRLLWRLPVVHGVLRDRGLADVCQVLADATDMGMPLDVALRQAEQLRINEVLRQRIDGWACRIEAGASVSDAARDAGLPRLVVGLLATARGGLPDVFGFLARYYRTRFSRTRVLLRGAVVPVSVLVMAVLVGSVALAMFLPIVHLIDRVSFLAGGPW